MIWSTAMRADRELRDQLVEQTRTASRSLNVERINRLSGTDADLSAPEYLRLKEQLGHLATASDKCRFVYLVGRASNGELFFFADNEPIGSDDESPAGEVYSEGSTDFRRVFDTKNAITEGPITDRWGTWISGLAPLTNPHNGQLIAVLGMDIDATTWKRDVAFATLPAFFLVLALMAIVVTGRILLARSARHADQPTSSGRNVRPCLVFATGVAVTLFAAWEAHHLESRNRAELFRNLAASKVALVSERIHDLRDIELEGLAGFYDSSEYVSSYEFEKYTQHIATNPAVRSWGWCQYVSAAEKPRFEQEMQADGLADFSVWEIDAKGDQVRATGRQGYLPLLRSSPMRGNERALGYDLGSEPLRLAALEESKRTRLPTASIPIPGGNGTNARSEMLICRPVFHRDAPSRLQGFALASVQLSRLLGGMTHDDTTTTGISLLGGSAIRKRSPPSPSEEYPRSKGLAVNHTLFGFGKAFCVTTCAGPGFMRCHPVRLGWLTFLTGIIFCGALTIVFGVIHCQQEKLTRLVAERTADLLASKGRLDQLAAKSRTVTWEVNAGGLFTYVSDVAEQVFGFQPEELVGRLHFYDLYPEEGREIFKAAAFDLFEQMERFQDLVNPIEARDGSIVWVTTTGLPLLDKSGRLLGYRGADTDITKRHHAEEALKSSERKLRTITDSALDAVIMIDSTGSIAHWNPAAERIFGYSGEEIVGQQVHKVLAPPRYHEAASKGHSHFASSGNGAAIGKTLELTALRKDGSEFQIEMSLNSIEQDDGWWAVAVLRDITERKQSEEKLRLLHRAVEQSSSTIVVTDADGRIQYANPQFEVSTGYALQETLGHNPRTLKSGKHTPTFYEELWKTISSGEQWRGEFVNRRKDGTLYWEAACISPVISDEGTITHYVAVKDDISDRKRAEEDLRDYAAALESANKALEEFSDAADAANHAKSGFLANMSHELRTPMTAILGFSDLLLDSVQKEEDLAAAETIKRNGEYLLELINGILDLAKIEAGRLEVERITCSPVNVVKDVVSLMQVRADAKGLPLKVEHVGAIPETVVCDPTWLRQILTNLLGNAIKFTESGSIRLVTRFVHGSTKPACLQFDVIDTGIGMAPDQAVRLFEPFAQADVSTTRKFGGTGLGLTISKRLAELLRGDISVASEPGKGTTFSLTIGTEVLDSSPVLENAPRILCDNDRDAKALVVLDSGLNCRILLAEDGPDNQRLICFILRKAGADVALAENGQLAYASALLAHDEGRPFDVILMDMQMPIMDGYEATRALREAGYAAPIVALTANAMVGDEEKCREAGCDGYATKPIDRTKLLEIIGRTLELSCDDSTKVAP